MIVIVEGPEKAGKSTFIRHLTKQLNTFGYKVELRKLGASDRDDAQYSPWLREDSKKLDTIVIWDRAWVSEYVYATMLDRDRRLKSDPWLGEWLHSRAVRPNGALFMVLPTDPMELVRRRDSTDLPVDPISEHMLFLQHAVEYGWHILEHSYTGPSLQNISDIALGIIMSNYIPDDNYLPPAYAGTVFSKYNKGLLVIVGKAEPAYEEAWLPGSSDLITRFGRSLGNIGAVCGWALESSVDDNMIRDASTIVTIGPKILDVVLHRLPKAGTADDYPTLWELSPAWMTDRSNVLKAHQIISSIGHSWWTQPAASN